MVKGRVGALVTGDATVARTRAKALNGAGWISMFQGDYGAAKPMIEEGLALYRGLEDEEGVASCLVNLGFVGVLGQREDVPVPTLLEEAMRLRPKLEERRTVANLLILAGVSEMGRGDVEKALALHEESLVLLREAWDVQSLGGCLHNMGIMEMARAEHSRASELLRESLRVARGVGDKTVIHLDLFGLAAVAAHEEQPVRAARLWGAAEALREAFGIQVSPLSRSLTDYENRLAAVRGQLEEEPFEKMWADGKAMAQDRSVEYALEEPPAASRGEQPVVDRQTVLTRREEEVALLVARGLTNRRIASELSISERTVATHVSKLLGKLGLNSRGQVAARVVKQRPIPLDPD